MKQNRELYKKVTLQKFNEEIRMMKTEMEFSCNILRVKRDGIVLY